MKPILLTLLLATSAIAEKPNILLIYADDLGYGDLSSYDQKHFQTPQIDSLATSGIRFTDHYSGSTVCAPSRDSLMTGRHTGQTSIRGNGEFSLPAEDTTVATLLKNAGYRTALIGKSCVTGNTQTPETLAQHGFDYFFGTTDHRDGHHRYPKFVYENTRKIEFPDNHLHRGSHYDLDFYRDKTLEVIGNHDSEAPFFLVLSLPVPHAAINVPEDSMARVRDGVQPDPIVSHPQQQPHYTHVEEPKTSYAGLMTRIDDTVGAILDTLREKGQLDNTLIIFTSDNGSHAEGGYHPDMLDSNGPLRGHKRDLYEGGIRVPMIAHWPARIPAGRETAHISAQWDFLPTACEAAGVHPPENIQGISYLPTLTDQGEQARHEFLYWEFQERNGRRALRAGDWKIVQYDLNADPQGAVELYNLTEDIGETNNLAADHPQIVEKLTTQMNASRVPSPLFPFPALDRISQP
jgi:arylsulfatase A